jgi:hypothetical protein
VSDPTARPVSLTTSGPPETVLPDEAIEIVHPLRQAEALDGSAKREAVAAVVAAYPRSLAAWAALGALGRDDVEAYAAYRVGYHRGLVTCLDGLRACASAIGELDEAERCLLFLHQLDPEWEHRS